MRGLVDVVGCRQGQEECVYLIERFGFQFRPRNEANEVQHHLAQNGHVKLHHVPHFLIEGLLEAKTNALVFVMRFLYFVLDTRYFFWWHLGDSIMLQPVVRK